MAVQAFLILNTRPVIEEIAKVCGSIGLSLAAHNSLCTGHILTFGNEEQKKKWLPKLATAEWIGAWGLTEANTGSDAGNMKCTAVKDGNDWVINGTKNWITHGKSGDIAVVICRTGEPRDKKQFNCFCSGKRNHRIQRREKGKQTRYAGQRNRRDGI